MCLKMLITQLQEIYHGKPWLDETFSKKLNDVNGGMAFIVPLNGVHSISEIVSHVTVWKKELLARFVKGEKKLHMHDPLDWRSNDDLKQNGWENLKTELFKSNDEFVNFLKTRNEEFLDLSYSDTINTKNRYFIEGCLHHDLYHLGQIGIVKKLLCMNY